MSDFKPHGTRLTTIPLEQIDTPEFLRALKLWETWRGIRSAPYWKDVSLVRFPPSLLPLATVVDVIDGGEDYRYRYWGSELTRLFKREETGHFLSSHVVPQSEDIRYRQFNAVVASGRPILFATVFEKFQGVMAQKLNLRLPTTEENSDVDKIISLSVLQRIAMQPNEDLSAFWESEASG